MKPAPAAILLAAGLAAFFLAKRTYDAQQREIGAVRVRLTATEDSLAGERRRADSLAAAFHVERETTRVTVVRYKTLRDTLLLSDTVILTHRESVLVAAADTAIHSCILTVESCENIQLSLRRQIGLVERERDLWKHKASPSLGDRLRDGAIKVSLGYLLGRLYP